MTPSQHALKAYLIAKLAEGVFAGITSPSQAIKKATAEFASDLPIVVSDLLDMMADSAAKTIGKIALDKVGEVARDVSKRGAGVVFREIKDKLDMQYQRGVERQRRGR